ncbi:MAG: hypothetical protein HKN51_11155 [Saprospiraceae bacterium]|nr:hypothetical protein [Bacteroidia bacterium]NNE15526.1 hypothetical protein [Saprospiraceae bacterium]
MENITHLQEQIQEKLNEFTKLEKVNAHLVDIEDKISEMNSKIRVYEKNLEKELKDIEKLEGTSVKSLFHKVLGSKYEQLEKERQEYLEVSLKYKEYCKRVELLEFERDLLSKKAKNIDEVKTELKQLMDMRKSEILRSDNIAVKANLENILNQIQRSYTIRKEISEAVIEGENSLKLLNVVISYLRKARDWGKWQNTNHSRRRGYVKNNAIDYAIKNLTAAQVRLDMFSKELADLGDNYIKFDLSRAQFGQFTDFFFDNLISDWIIQQKIKSTMANVESVVDKIQRILLGLKGEDEKNTNNIEQLIKQKNKILTD